MVPEPASWSATLAESAPLMALVLFTLISLGLGVVAKFFASDRFGFMRKYFLGNRSLGAFAVALTAAVMSGGTFVGFPSLVYSFGWVVGLWICSYMVGGLTVLGLMGKRIGQLARKTGAITLPDLLRERYGSPFLGLLTSLLVMMFLTVNLVAQFKAGALIVKGVLPAGVVSLFGGDPAASGSIGTAYYIGLIAFSTTVVFYTAFGGFLAAIWTDVFQSIIMAIGVLILLPLALMKTGGIQAATVSGMELAGDGFGFGPGAGRAFHPITLAISYFFMWAISGAGQPSTMVRLMAFRNSKTLRYAIGYLTAYNAIVYIPLIIVFICARSLLPDLAAQGRSDEAMTEIVKMLANPYVAGLILAAPYGAVMSTVSGFLLIVASGLVRDLYQRFLRPKASEREIEWASYIATACVGLIVAFVALNPPEYLQLIVIFSGSGMAASFLVPGFLGCYWRRATGPGAIAAMVAGAGATLFLYALGSFGLGAFGLDGILPPNPDIGAMSKFRAYYLLGFDPCVWGLGASLAAGVGVSLITKPPTTEHVSLLFDAQPADAPAPATVALHPELGPSGAHPPAVEG